MTADRYNNLAAFRAFLDAKLVDPGNDLTLDEALALWEAETQAHAESDDARETIRGGPDEFHADEPPQGPPTA